MSASLHYDEFAPPSDLDESILTFWSFRNPPDGPDPWQHTVPVDGCMGIVVSLPPDAPGRVIVLGAHDTPRTVPVPAGSSYWGIRFWPDTGAAFLGVDADAWVGRAAPPPAPLAARVASLGPAIRQSATDADAVQQLTTWCRTQPRPTIDPTVRLAVLAIVAARGTVTIGALAQTLQCSDRQLLRRFRRATGLSLKRYARVRRFREAAARHLAAPRATWSQIAAEFGYSDHAHLTREFREIVGAAPSDVARFIAHISHGRIRP